ncbi:MAG: ABC transporter substrate-binding protein [Rhodobacteraceae bacterium]|nr:ABC transporter substrate-binding protein [Paracoccaceae bacterium]
MSRFYALLGALSLCLVIGAVVAVTPSERSGPFVIGVLHPTAVDEITFQGFKDKLKELGHVEGGDIVFNYDGPVGRGDKLTAAAEKLVSAKVDLIFASSTPATKAAEKATQGTGIAVVFGPVNDPIAAEVVSSLRNPGGNVTGVMLPRSGGKRLKWLVDLTPGLQTVLVPYNPDNVSSVSSTEQAQAAAESLGVEVIPHAVRDANELGALLQNIPEGVGGLFLPRDGMITGQLPAIHKATVAQGLALSVPGLNQVKKGGFVSYGFAHVEVGRRAAEIADKIISGSKPAEIPVATATSFLAVNLPIAKQIGAEIPDDVLKQARIIVR